MSRKLRGRALFLAELFFYVVLAWVIVVGIVIGAYVFARLFLSVAL